MTALTLKQKLTDILTDAVRHSQQQNKLPRVAMPEISLERPQNPTHGDYATSLPLKLARSCAMNPMLIARTLSESLHADPELVSVAIAPPGFINFTCSSQWLVSQVDPILARGEGYGNLSLGQRQSVQVEFVSANPTGPLHVGHGRGAVLGSALAAILAAAGYNVQTEYYVNDAGNQMQAFYQSLWARYQQELGREVAMPEAGYHGRYMIDLAKDMLTEHGDRYLAAQDGQAELGRLGVKKMLSVIEDDLSALGINFDHWFSEQSLYDSGEFTHVLNKLRDKGYLADKEGATWFTSTALGEDKDNVVIRSDGTATYFGTDIAYHHNKFVGRSFERAIDIWGADHQGHVPRMKAAITALGIDPSRLHIIVSQLVTLRRGGESVRVSKRSGDIITLRDVIDEVGTDACRFFFLARSADSQMDFDLELAKKESSENPVYYIQYAHARIASILRLAADEGLDHINGNTALLTSEPELALIRQMLRLPEIIEFAARSLEPQHLPYYAQELATAFHSFYKQCRVVSQDEPALSCARLKLVAATKTVLARTLSLMGMAAPEKM